MTWLIKEWLYKKRKKDNWIKANSRPRTEEGNTREEMYHAWKGKTNFNVILSIIVKIIFC